MEISETFFTTPAGYPGKDEKILSVLEALSDMGIAYRGTTHEHADTIEACRGVEKAIGAPICKNLFLCNRQKTAFYLLIMPGDKPFKTKYLSEQIGSARLSFADGADMERLIGCRPGSASMLGLLFDREKQVRFLIDRDLLAEEYWGFHPCVNTATLRLKRTDLTGVFPERLGVTPEYVSLPRE